MNNNNMRIKTSNIEFPVVWIKEKENSMGVYKNSNELTICLNGTEKFLNNLSIISSSGNYYQIENITKKGKKIPLKKWGLLKYFGYYNIEVQINFIDKIEKLSLEELKEKIIFNLENFSEFWDADGRLSILLDLINKATLEREIISLLEKKYFAEPFA